MFQVMMLALMISQPQAPLPPQAPPAQQVVAKKVESKAKTCACSLGDRCTCGAACDCKPLAKKESPPAFLDYAAAYQHARSEGKRLAVFVGVRPREIAGVVSTSVPTPHPNYAAYRQGAVVVLANLGVARADDLGDFSSRPDDDIRTGREVQPMMAAPFELLRAPSALPRQQPTADDNGPWLPVGEQQKIKAMWPEGVPFPETLRFYKLRPASQVLAKVNNDIYRAFHSMRSHATNVNRDFPYAGSGGMDWAAPGTWRNVTGLAIPHDKSIAVWTHLKPVLNSFGSYQDEYVLDWSFPEGTQAYDVLLRQNDDGSEHIFTVRMREKLAGGKWSDGVSFFPDVQGGEITTYHTPGNSRTRNVLGVERISYRVLEMPRLAIKKYRFKETQTALADDGHFFPPGFKGTGMTCTKCHVQSMNSEAAPYSGPMLRGQDTVFSWSPVLQSDVSDTELSNVYQPRLDRRWPITVY